MLCLKTYSCNICHTTPGRFSQHKSHLVTQAHVYARNVYEYKLSKLDASELIQMHGTDHVHVIVKKNETVIANNSEPQHQPTMSTAISSTSMPKLTPKTKKVENAVIWTLVQNVESNDNYKQLQSKLQGVIRQCHNLLYSNGAICGTKAQNDIMRLLCLCILKFQFTNKTTDLWAKCMEVKTTRGISDKNFEKYVSYCTNLMTLAKVDNFTNEWKMFVNNFLVFVFPSIYYPDDAKFNSTDEKVVIQLIVILDELEIDDAFISAFATSCGDIHESFREYGGGKGAKELGQYFTPRHLVHLIFYGLGCEETINQYTNPTIYDPCMGTAGFLTRLFGLGNISPENIYGCETEIDTIKFGECSILLTTNSINNNVVRCDSLCQNPFIFTKKFDDIHTNPPFGTKMKYKALNEKFDEYKKLNFPDSLVQFKDVYPIVSNNGACLFIQHCVYMLEDGGMCAIVLPDGVLFDGNEFKKFRKWLCENVNIRTILKVPSGVFEHAGVKTNTVIFTKTGATQNIQWLKTNKECNIINSMFITSIEELHLGEFSLDAGTYLEDSSAGSYDVPMVELGTIVEFLPKSNKYSSHGNDAGKYPFYTSSAICKKWCDECDYNELCLIIAIGGSANIKMCSQFSCSKHNLVIKTASEITTNYLHLFLKFNIHLLENGFHGAALKHLTKDYLKKIQIPLPSLEIQSQIVEELSALEISMCTIQTRMKEIKREKELYYKYGRVPEIMDLLRESESKLLGGDCAIQSGKLNSNDCNNDTSAGSSYDVPMVELGTIVEFLPRSNNYAYHGNDVGKYPFYTSSAICKKWCDECEYNELCLIIGAGGCANIKMCSQFSCSKHNFVIKTASEITTNYLHLFLKFNIQLLENGFHGVGVKNLSKDYLKKIQIPLPSHETQEQCIKIWREKDSQLREFDKKIESEHVGIEFLKQLGKDIILTFCGNTDHITLQKTATEHHNNPAQVVTNENAHIENAPEPIQPIQSIVKVRKIVRKSNPIATLIQPICTPNVEPNLSPKIETVIQPITKVRKFVRKIKPNTAH